MILFSTAQFKEFGYKYFECRNYSYRYQESRKLFYRSIYIPLGPMCNNLDDIEKFLQDAKDSHFTRFKVDLPLILDKRTREKVCNLFEKYGFKKSVYIQDEETLIVTPDNYHISKRDMQYVRRGLRNHGVKIFNSNEMPEIKTLYNIYVENAERVGFTPKNREGFQRIFDNCLGSYSLNKNTNEITGFLLGYITQIPYNKSEKSMLQLIFTGLSQNAVQDKIGYALHYVLFNYAFENIKIDFIDFQGASRTKNRSYVKFKQCFGGEFIDLPGSYVFTNFL